jgi:ferredoxin--NADP+ reductase
MSIPHDAAAPLDVETLRRRHYNAVIADERFHHGAVMVIRVVPDIPIPAPNPGQWLELGLGLWERPMQGTEAGSARRKSPDALIRRSYSLSSPILGQDGTSLLEPSGLDGFEFFLSLVVPPEERARHAPNLTGRLFCLRPGARLFLSDRPLGEYSLDPVEPGSNVLFLATGTGEAPHNFMIWALLRSDHPGRVASIVSVRRRGDLAYDPVHRRLTSLFPQYRYASLVTREHAEPKKHLQDLLEDGSLETMAGFPLDPARTQIYLCGNPGMIGPPRIFDGERRYPHTLGMVELLERRGFNADLRRSPVNLHYERYW